MYPYMGNERDFYRPHVSFFEIFVCTLHRPLMLTQLLEVLFNLSDVAVVGKFASYQALGSVGSTSTLVTLFAGFLIGMGAGVNVAVARALGIGSEEETEKTIHSAFIICTIFGVVVCLACNLFARQMLASAAG